jgi:hypothetical protein
VILDDDGRITVEAIDATRREGSSGPTPFALRCFVQATQVEQSLPTIPVTGSGAEPADADDFTPSILAEPSVLQSEKPLIWSSMSSGIRISKRRNVSITLSNARGRAHQRRGCNGIYS